MSLTEKDILLLKLAVSVLTVFLMVRFLMVPGIGRYQELMLEGRELDEKITNMQSAIDGIPELQQRLSKRQKELGDISAKYYESMENRQIDELLTGIALKAGLFPVSLSIGETRAEIPGAYLYGKSSGGRDDFFSGEADGSEGEKGQADAAAGGYIRTVSCAMVLQGSSDQIYQFVDDIAYHYPAVQIRAMHVSERTYLDTEWNVVEQPEVRFELAVYMHDSIGKKEKPAVGE